MLRRLSHGCGLLLLPTSTLCLVSQRATQHNGSSPTVASLDRRVKQLEDSACIDGLLAFYGRRLHSEFDMSVVARRCMDPDYNTYIFSHKELPLFLAHHVRAIDNLPVGLNAMDSIAELRRMMADSFQRLVKCPLPLCAKTRAQFLDAVRDIHDRRQDTDILRKMALGVLELKEHLSRHTRARLTATQQEVRHDDIYRRILPELRLLQEPLDECNRYFIYYNFLAGQLMNLSEGPEARSRGRIGTIDTEVNLLEVVKGAVEEAKTLCTHVYSDCPDVKVIVPNDGEAMAFAHKSSTIHYILVELMKNALRATVDAHMTKNAAGIVTCDDMPPVKVLVTALSSMSHACVCIEDEGKGIPRNRMDLVMSYTYTTAAKPALEQIEAAHHHHTSTDEVDMSPLAGYGFGLPVSRMYARCFGGDLALQSIEGFGTKAYLYIKQGSTF